MDYDIFELGDIGLQSGETLPQAFLAYKTYGTLNATKDNVIVFPTSFGDQHYQNEWLIGINKALNPEKYFIVIPNMLGNGLSSSPSNAASPFDKANFPNVTIFDNVALQHRLLTERFGVKKVVLATGWSMGAIQAFQWGASYPDMVERLAPFAGTAKTWPHNSVMIEGIRAALQADAAWNKGMYTAPPELGLRTLGRVYASWGFSQAFYREECFKELGYASLSDFISSFWEESFFQSDANDLLAMMWTWQHADISRNPLYDGDFAFALNSIKARTVVMPVRTDLYFTAEDSQYETSLIPNATFQPIESIWGHLAGFGLNPTDANFIDSTLKVLLERT
ncbi:alpha/beta fold hydrolase [Brevibacillus reuszeri]|uniref:alpha/beta fold hydrolase n=1 Tax=Brevibacillus reuszeri TaxID=54915 RepID=UPI000CCC4825|nr:alpha/beta fold hydrolase [Brevibacillus reuszeri]